MKWVVGLRKKGKGQPPRLCALGRGPRFVFSLCHNEVEEEVEGSGGEMVAGGRVCAHGGKLGLKGEKRRE